jgi:peroxiredoxin
MDKIEPTIGTKAPEFKLPANVGNEIGLADYLTRMNIYLFFVREFN